MKYCHVSITSIAMKNCLARLKIEVGAADTTESLPVICMENEKISKIHHSKYKKIICNTHIKKTSTNMIIPMRKQYKNKNMPYIPSARMSSSYQKYLATY